MAPGGSLHIVDFGEQSRLPRAFRTALRAWLGKFSVDPREGLERELEQLAQRSGAKLTLARPFRDYARECGAAEGAVEPSFVNDCF